ncbi:MAG: hypothetical protein R3258_04990 [Acidimicrobiia bacterium]|nr:hypothetical protein [Acidimicrobiia bacterium]
MYLVFRRFVAVFYAYGALVHAANLVGLGPPVPGDRVAVFTVLDVIFLVVDSAIVIGLWTGRNWGLVLFFLAAGSQMVMYVGFDGYFAFDEASRNSITQLIVFHLVSATVMFSLLWAEQRSEPADR